MIEADIETLHRGLGILDRILDQVPLERNLRVAGWETVKAHRELLQRVAAVNAQEARSNALDRAVAKAREGCEAKKTESNVSDSRDTTG